MTHRVPGMEEHRYQESAQPSPEGVADFHDSFKNLLVEFEVPEAERSPELAARIESLEATYKDLLTELGIDASQRTPPTAKLAVYGEKDWNAVAEAQGLEGRRCQGIAILQSGQILVSQGATADETARKLAHEMAHVLAPRTWEASLDDKGMIEEAGIKRAGFEGGPRRAFKYFNELVTETIAIEVSRRDAVRRGQDGAEVLIGGYTDGVVFLDHLLAAAGKKLGRKPRELRTGLFRGYFEGDMASLRFIEDAFGAGALKILAELRESGGKDWFVLSEAAQKIGLDDTAYFYQITIAADAGVYRLNDGTKLVRPTDGRRSSRI